jgi:N-acyl-D-aspartate/D-glutamate deacylase
MTPEIVGRGGTIVDGTGAELFVGDLSCDDGRIIASGADRGGGGQVIDADEMIVSLALDKRTHLDAQIRCDLELTP